MTDRPARVLLVDDEESVRKLVGVFLRRRGYEVVTASDGGGAALEAIRSARPDLVITDLNMPGVDGRELTRRLRQDAATADLPVVVLSAMKQQLPELLAEPSPPDACLAKPVEMAELASLIAGLLAKDGRAP